jgi:hypothetical protein
MKDGNDTFKKISSPMYKLYWMLAPNKDILSSRNRKLKEKFASE